MAGKNLSVHLLGNFHLVCDGQPVAGLDSPRLQSFLAYLILHSESPIQRQQLAFIFWPDSNESQARTNLRNTLYKVREAFPEADTCLEISNQTLWWNPDLTVELDLEDFQSAVEKTDITGSGKDQAAHRQALLAAVDAYQGDLLPGCYDDWIQPQRERLRQRFLRALEELVESLVVDQEFDQALPYAQELIRQDPLLESSYGLLMSIYLGRGEKARAVRTYHQCVEVLEKELGLDPGPATIQLYQEALEREAAPAPAPPPRVTEKSARLVGRQSAWDSLLETWHGYDSGARLAVIMGEAGVGKTYLAEDFLRWSRRAGASALKARSYPTDDELAFAPVAALLRNERIYQKLGQLGKSWLAELARLLPELREEFPDLPDPERVSENWKRQRLFEACIRALLQGESRLAILLDDLQWCDRDTLDWLHFLVEHLSEAKVLVLAGVRTEDLLPDSPLLPFFAALGGGGKISEVLLDRLDLEATQTLAADLWGEAIEDQTVVRLYQETEGNPLFIAELVRAGFLTAPAEISLPPRVQAVIETRLNALAPDTRELAELAATVGREFDYQLLLHAGDRPEKELLGCLDELWSRRLIRDEGTENYNFSHDKFRESLYEGLSPHRRTYYHQKVAAALEQIHAGSLEAAAPQLAYQYDRAGDLDRALDYYIMAGDQSQLIYARQDALSYYKTAAKLLKKDDDPRMVQIYQGWGDVQLKLADYDQAAEIYQKLLRSTQILGDCEAEARAWLAVGTIQDRQGDHSKALKSASRALELSKDNDCEIEEAEALLLKGQSIYRLGNAAEAEPIIQEAFRLSEEREDHFTAARCLSHLGLVQDDLGSYQRAKEYKNRALEMMKDIEGAWVKEWIGTIQMNLANTATLNGEHQEAINLYQSALEIYHQTKHQDMVLVCLVNMAAAKSGLGQHPEAEADLRQVLDLVADAEWLGRSITCFLLAEACLGQGKLEQALDAALDSLDHARETGAQQALGAAWRVLGKAASRMKEKIAVHGELRAARDCFQRSKEVFREIEAEAELAHTLQAWGEHELERGDKGKGHQLEEEAQELFDNLGIDL